MSRVGHNRLYIYALYDCVFDEIPAKFAVHIRMVMANPKYEHQCCTL